MVLMTEPPHTAPTPPCTPEEAKSAKTTRKDAKGIQPNSELDSVGEDRPKRSGKPQAPPELPVDTESDPSECKRKVPVRSKGIDQPSPLQSPSEYEVKLGRKKSQSSQFSKTNAQYHKIFKEISKDELLLQSYTCALQKDILYQGKLFVSDNWICFYSRVFGRDTKIAIPVLSVTFIKKTKTAILVPNAIVITTTSDRHVFVSFLSRDTTFKLLKSVCVHLDGDNMGSSPTPSSAENSFRGERPLSLPLDFSGEFSDLDGVVRHRRQEVLESSSSGSQTPDYDKMSEFPGLAQNFLSGEVSVHADIHLQQAPEPRHGAPLRNGPIKAAVSGHKARPVDTHALSLNTLLFIYLFLVCVLVLSSCYMALKIVALEQRLSSLGSITEYSHNENTPDRKDQLELNAEMYGELSTNLFKIEKIQKNLQKLLEET